MLTVAAAPTKVIEVSRPSEKPRSSFRPAAPLTTFATIWACATLVHLVAFPFWARTWQGWTLVLAVGLTLAEPRSLARFSFLVVASLLNLARQMPFVPNHILFEGMINLTILTSIFWVRFTGKNETEVAPTQTTTGHAQWKPWTILAGYLALMMAVEDEFIGGAATFLMVPVLHVLFKKPQQESAAMTSVYHHFAPIVRVQIVIMYFWSVVQKFNWDYLDPTVSAAAIIHREIAQFLPLLPSDDWTLPIAIWGSLFIEFAIPCLLLSARTRRLGFVVAIGFHSLLSLHPHPGIFSFSALIFAALSLFLPNDDRVQLTSIWSKQRESISQAIGIPFCTRCSAACVHLIFFGTFGAFAIIYQLFGENHETFLFGCSIAIWLWFAWGAWLAYGYLKIAAKKDSLRGPLEGKLTLTPALLGIVLVFANGLAPWLGLKTQTTFSMFSNLRTEFQANHVFLKRVPLFSYQDDMVEILASEPNVIDPKTVPHGIELYANTGNIFAAFELRRLLSRWDGDVHVELLRGNERLVIERVNGVANHPEWFAPIDPIRFKFLWFRRHERWDGPMHATH